MKNKTEKIKNAREKDHYYDYKRYREIRDIVHRVGCGENSVIKNDYIRKRFLQSLIWYIKKAKFFKRFFYFFSVLSIIIPIAVALLNQFVSLTDDSKIIVSILSSLTAVISSLLTLFKLQEKWIQYRCAAEALQSELSLLIAENGDYSFNSFIADEKAHFLQKNQEGTKGFSKEREQADASFEEDDYKASRAKIDFFKSDYVNYRERLFLLNIERIMSKEKSQWEKMNKTKE